MLDLEVLDYRGSTIEARPNMMGVSQYGSTVRLRAVNLAPVLSAVT